MAIWARLKDVITKTYKHESGAELPISLALIDSGYLADKVYKFCKSMKRVYPVKGISGAYGKPLLSYGQGKLGGHRIGLYIVNTDLAKDIVHDLLQRGKMHFNE
ncbi:phage terminase large subunit family protein, partial [Candidatus Bathyarchaeota archaeon]|nr:phage terminase large subunit family protein [Candidatus Bathyarchaeota archaeon]